MAQRSDEKYLLKREIIIDNLQRYKKKIHTYKILKTLDSWEKDGGKYGVWVNGKVAYASLKISKKEMKRLSFYMNNLFFISC